MWGMTSVLWSLFSTMKIKIWNITNFQRILKPFPELISLRNQIDHIAGLKCWPRADMVKDLGYKWQTRLLTIFCGIFLVTVAEFVSSLWSKAHWELQQFCVVFSVYSGWTRIWSVFKVSNGRGLEDQMYHSKMNRPGPCNYLSNLVVNTVRFVIFTLHRLSVTQELMLAILRWRKLIQLFRCNFMHLSRLHGKNPANWSRISPKFWWYGKVNQKSGRFANGFPVPCEQKWQV